MQKLRVGIVGCGEVTQTIHLPALQHLNDEFSVTALCDVSPTVLAAVGARVPSAVLHDSYLTLTADPNVDVVLVANPHAYHTDVAIAALAAGKHVFVEKPMSMNLAQADALMRAEQQYGKLVQVGYMRRYAGAFLEAVKLVTERRSDVRFARVHDFIGVNQLIVNDTSNVARGNDIPTSAATELTALNTRLTAEAVGSSNSLVSRAYGLLLGLSSHDLSAMRELLGMPKSVLNATARSGGLYITATFDYGDFVCEFATGVDQIPRYETYLEVYTGNRVIRVDYDTPYVRSTPARLSITEPSGTAGVATNVSFPSRLDSFVVEWRDFFGHVSAGTKPKTTVADSRLDLVLFEQIVERLKAPAAEEPTRKVG